MRATGLKKFIYRSYRTRLSDSKLLGLPPSRHEQTANSIRPDRPPYDRAGARGRPDVSERDPIISIADSTFPKYSRDPISREACALKIVVATRTPGETWETAVCGLKVSSRGTIFGLASWRRQSKGKTLVPRFFSIQNRFCLTLRDRWPEPAGRGAAGHD